MLKNLYANCLSLSLAILAQFTPKKCVAAQSREKFTKTPTFGGSRSFKVIDVDTPKNSYACCLALSYGISSQFTIKMCVAAKKIAKNYQNTSYGSSKSFKVTNVDKSKSPSPVLVIISSTSGPILTCLQARSCFLCLEIWLPLLEESSNIDGRFIIMLT